MTRYIRYISTFLLMDVQIRPNRVVRAGPVITLPAEPGNSPSSGVLVASCESRGVPPIGPALCHIGDTSRVSAASLACDNEKESPKKPELLGGFRGLGASPGR